MDISEMQLKKKKKSFLYEIVPFEFVSQNSS